MRSPLLALLLTPVLLAAALPARADTYKWVDEKGVTNYSSTPPAGTAKRMAVEDRLSVVPTDPAWKEAAAMSAARPDYAAEEWLQRQRLMALKDSYTATAYPYQDPYYSGYGYYPAYGYPVFPGARARAIHAGMPVATPRSGGTLRVSAGGRGGLVR